MGSRGSSMSHYSSGAKRWHYSTLLLLALGAAMLSVLVVHKLREGRVLGLLLRDRESNLFSLQLILERERAHSKEMKAKIEELKAKAASLRSQKLRLSTRLMEAQNLAAHLKNKRTELELALQEKQAKLITSLEGAEEASVKANKQVDALTDMLKQQQQQQQGGHGAGEMERRRPQRTATNKVDDDGAKEMESGEHGQGSKGGGGWVRIETNTDDAEPVVVDGGDGAGSTVKEEIIGSDGAKQPEVTADQVGEQNSATVDGELPVVKDEVTMIITNTTETNLAAPKDGKPEQKDNSADGDGEEKQTKEDSQHEESSETADDHEKQTDNQQVIDGNVTEVNDADQVQLKVPENQTASTTQEEVAEVQPQVISAAVGIVGASGSSGGDENSEARSTSTESYQDTNGSDQMTINSAADDRTVSDNKESSTSEGGSGALREEGGPENKEENSVRSTVETSEQSAASHGGQTENVHGSESSWKEDQGSGQSGSEQPEEKIAGDEEKKTGDSTDLTQQGANVDTDSAEEEAANNEAQQE